MDHQVVIVCRHPYEPADGVNLDKRLFFGPLLYIEENHDSEYVTET
jgi:hypothetical protein